MICSFRILSREHVNTASSRKLNSARTITNVVFLGEDLFSSLGDALSKIERMMENKLPEAVALLEAQFIDQRFVNLVRRGDVEGALLKRAQDIADFARASWTKEQTVFRPVSLSVSPVGSSLSRRLGIAFEIKDQAVAGALQRSKLWPASHKRVLPPHQEAGAPRRASLVCHRRGLSVSPGEHLNRSSIVRDKLIRKSGHDLSDGFYQAGRVSQPLRSAPYYPRDSLIYSTRSTLCPFDLRWRPLSA